jgi:hypothetical protein
MHVGTDYTKARLVVVQRCSWELMETLRPQSSQSAAVLLQDTASLVSTCLA